MSKQLKLDLHNQLIVDLFAGGGGMSVAFEMAFGRSPDIAINHNEDALSMHRVNHPETRHFIADVFEVCPHGATQGRPVGWLHLSPDCTHHSQASAGQPRSKKLRGLAWVGRRWRAQVRPVCISLENVKQIQQWCPLIAKRDKETGRALKRILGSKEWAIAEPGERVPVQDQYLIPDPKRIGETWKKYVRDYEKDGYEVEVRLIRAADHGGHTTRERLFMLARCDGQPIEWPEIKYFKNPKKGQLRWKGAHECIDFSHPCPSIFGRPRPLALNTKKRIAKGIAKFVLESTDPFIVPIAHFNGAEPVHSIREPIRTVTAEPKGGSFAIAVPSIVAATHHGADRVHELKDPFATITAAHRGEMMLSTPILAKIRGDSHGTELKLPMPTVTSGGNMERDAGAAHALGLISPILVQAAHGEGQPGKVQRWGDGSTSVKSPLGAITASGGHALAAATLVGVGGPEYSGKPVPLDAPVGTLLTENHRGIATAYLMQANDGFNTTPGHEMGKPVSAITSSGSQQQLVTAHLATLRNNCHGVALDESVPVVAAGGEHHGLVSAFLSSYYTDESNRCREATEPAATITTENRIGLVECTLSKEHEEGALRVAAFLMEFYSQGGQWSDLRDPMNTLTTKERMALVTVTVKGTPYVIVDIGLRMLKPRELYNAQDFPASYIIDHGHDGRKFNITKQVRMVGNSVDPLMAVDFLKLNAPKLAIRKVA
jgi:DNA (cytosine-5)-methyltransferase 1